MRIVILLALREVEGSEPALAGLPAEAGKSKDLNALLSKNHQSRSVRTYYGQSFESSTT